MKTVKLKAINAKLLLVKGYEVETEIAGTTTREHEYIIYLEFGNNLYLLPTQFCSRGFNGTVLTGFDRALSMATKIRDAGEVSLSAWVPATHDCHTLNATQI